jgi:5-methylcytosine-specific restriction endonuclease McrA
MCVGDTCGRGNVTDRRRRREWLVSPRAPFGGNGTYVPCAAGCLTLLTVETLEVDKIIPTALGGRYVRSNIQPLCLKCNRNKLDKVGWVSPYLPTRASLTLAI